VRWADADETADQVVVHGEQLGVIGTALCNTYRQQCQNHVPCSPVAGLFELYLHHQIEGSRLYEAE